MKLNKYLFKQKKITILEMLNIISRGKKVLYKTDDGIVSCYKHNGNIYILDVNIKKEE